jgi:class 3 adenylate cyclase/pimeloyl-ACP methyl ester carboxylesterase
MVAPIPKHPQVRYARSGELDIAYRVVGQGERDLVIVLPTVSTMELLFEPPALALNERLARSFRLILFDRRGTGLSAQVAAPATLEEQMADIEAVMDATRATNAAIYAEAEGVAMALLFAATHPQRVSHLLLLHGFARITGAPGYDFARDEEARRREFIDPVIAGWGTGEWGRGLAPVLASRDPDFVGWWGRWEALSAPPATARALFELSGRIDVREVLPEVRVPTLVMHRPQSGMIDIRHSRYIAERIPDATYRELPGRDAISFGDGLTEQIEACEAFVGGTARRREHDRVLATVLFTDIAGSTELAARIGDRAWRELRERHDELTRSLIATYGGRAVKSTGDGYLATFDGPARAVRCALGLVEAVRELGLELRAGLHTGEVDLIGDDVGGMAVHIGARIASLTGAGEVCTSSTVRDLVVGSGLGFEDAGERELKGVPGSWRVLRVTEPESVEAASVPVRPQPASS